MAHGFAFGRGMELLFLITVLAFVALYVAYREWLNATHKRWVMELDLFKKRLATYEELKIAVAPLRARGEVSQSDADRFAGAMADMRFLFDKELESFFGGIYGALLKKRALDALLEQVASRAKSPEDKELTEMAERRSRELSHQISDAIDRDMPRRNEKFMYPGPVL